MRVIYDRELASLEGDMAAMGALCEEAIAMAAGGLTVFDAGRSGEVRDLSHEIDKMERDIENRCLKLLLKQQPIAQDLRKITAALKMITDMERIGDQAEDIAEICTYFQHYDSPTLQQLHHMAEEAMKMVKDSVEAFVTCDVALARAVLDYDDVVDAKFDAIKSSIIAAIAAHPTEGENALDHLMIAKYLERIGDHATNIAEWVIYSVTGVHPKAES